MLSQDGTPGRVPSIFDANNAEGNDTGMDRNNRTSIDIKEELHIMSKETQPGGGDTLSKPSTAAPGSIRIKKSTHLNATKFRQIEIQEPLPRSKNISR